MGWLVVMLLHLASVCSQWQEEEELPQPIYSRQVYLPGFLEEAVSHAKLSLSTQRQ